MALPPLSRFTAAALPVVNVCLLCLVGAYLASKGVLDAKGRKRLSQAIFHVFVPALVFVKVGDAVDLSNFARWWSLPVNVIASIGIGLALGWCVATLLRTPEEFKRHVIVAMGCGNVGNLPMVLMAGLCHDRGLPLALPEMLRDAVRCEARGITYVAFSMWVAGLFQFSVAYTLLKPKVLQDVLPLTSAACGVLPLDVSQRPAPRLLPAQTPNSPKSAAAARPGKLPRDEEATIEAGASWGPRACGAVLPDSNMLVIKTGCGCNPGLQPRDTAFRDGGVSIELPAYPAQGCGYPAGPGNTAAVPAKAKLSDKPELAEQEAQALLGPHPPGAPRLLPPNAFAEGKGAERGATDNAGCDVRWHCKDGGTAVSAAVRLLGTVQCVGTRLAAAPWGEVFNPPTLAAFAALAIGCTPAVKAVLFGPAAPLAFMRRAIETLGDCMIPCMMLVLGGVLYKGPGTSRAPLRLIGGVTAFRLLVMPVIGMGLVFGLRAAGIIVPPDNLFMLCLLLSHTTPTAINVQVISSMHQSGEAEVSCLLFYQYLASIVTLPLFTALYLHWI